MNCFPSMIQLCCIFILSLHSSVLHVHFFQLSSVSSVDEIKFKTIIPASSLVIRDHCWLNDAGKFSNFFSSNVLLKETTTLDWEFPVQATKGLARQSSDFIEKGFTRVKLNSSKFIITVTVSKSMKTPSRSTENLKVLVELREASSKREKCSRLKNWVLLTCNREILCESLDPVATQHV